MTNSIEKRASSEVEQPEPGNLGLRAIAAALMTLPFVAAAFVAAYFLGWTPILWVLAVLTAVAVWALGAHLSDKAHGIERSPVGYGTIL